MSRTRESLRGDAEQMGDLIGRVHQPSRTINVKIAQPQHGVLVALLAPRDERVRQALAEHRRAVEKAGEAIDEAEDARDAVERAPVEAEAAGRAAARAGKASPPKQPNITELSAAAGFTRERAAELAKVTRATAVALDDACLAALPDHASAIMDASDAVAEWETARRDYQAVTQRALTRAGQAWDAAAHLLRYYDLDPADDNRRRADVAALAPTVLGSRPTSEADLHRFAQPFDLIANLDWRAANPQGYHAGSPRPDDDAVKAAAAADRLRPVLTT